MVVGTSKFEICRAGWQIENFQKGVESTVLRQNFLFLIKSLVLFLRPSND
jgi:hypothetical protein